MLLVIIFSIFMENTLFFGCFDQDNSKMWFESAVSEKKISYEPNNTLFYIFRWVKYLETFEKKIK